MQPPVPPLPTDRREPVRDPREAPLDRRARAPRIDDDPGDEGGWGHQSELGISLPDTHSDRR